jgi:hypothetical protein
LVGGASKEEEEEEEQQRKRVFIPADYWIGGWVGRYY